MKVRMLAVIWAAGSCLAAGWDPESQAERALELGLPSIAAALLEGTEADPCLLARARLALGDAPGALHVLQKAAGRAEADFLAAEAHALAGDAQQALAAYTRAADVPMFHTAARLGAARALAALGRRAEAAQLFQDLARQGIAQTDYAEFLMDSGDVGGALRVLEKAGKEEEEGRRRVLLARAAFASGDAEGALARLSAPLPAQSAAEAAFLRAEIELARGEEDAAEEALETFIERYPQHPDLPRAFEKLDAALAAQTSPSVSALRRWASDAGHARRAGLAAYSLGKAEWRAARADRAVSAWRRVLELPVPPDLADAAAAEIRRVAGEEPADAAGRTPGPRELFQQASRAAQAGRFEEAAGLFQQIYAETGWASAQENARLCAVAAGQPLPDPPSAPVSLLEAEAMRLAAQGRPEALPKLEALANAKSAGGASERAHLALAEIRWLEGKRAQARRGLRQASWSDPENEERARVLEIFLEDDGTRTGAERVIAAADRIIPSLSNAALAAEATFKRGEAFFRIGDYAAARRDFERVQTSGPAHVSAPARLLEALCAARSVDAAERAEALELLDGLASEPGPLADRARLEQAFLLAAEGRPAESLAVLEKLLSLAQQAEIRWAALIEKGDILFSQAGGSPEAIRQAIAAWRLVSDTDAPPRWRNQALSKIATAHERLGEIPAALAAAWRALDAADGENFWSVKAGFDAARLLEQQSRLDEAIVVYEKLAARGGSRAEEARQRLERLRLENFLWDGSLPPPIAPNP